MKIGLLNAYHFDPSNPDYQVKYGQMAMGFFESVFGKGQVKLYAVALGEFPSDVDECDGWIITGSPKSAYDLDPWILKLGEFVQKCHGEKKKLVGICFGHQLIAHYLGGLTEKSEKGWGVGIRSFHLVKNEPWMIPEHRQISALFSHQDQVVRLPAGATHLAEDPFCPNQMYTLGKHILSMQCHPEFSVEFAKMRLESSKESVESQTYENAMKSYGGSLDNGPLGDWIKKFFSWQ